ncbi:MAG TPA: flagellar biosynthetic protein FliO [Paenibacillus sp.]|jgi:flagellar protein FliO/FliZ
MSGSDQAFQPPSATSPFLSIFYVIIVLAIIVTLIILLIRFLGKKNRSWFNNRSVRILGGVGLGANKTLQIIEIGTSVYLVGVGEDIRLVDKISDPEEVAYIISAFEEESTRQQNMMIPSIMSIVDKFRKKDQSQEIELEEGTSFHEVFDSKLRRMSSRKDKMEEMMQEDNTTDRLRDS